MSLSANAVAQTNVTVSFVTTNSTPLNLGFATELPGTRVEIKFTNWHSGPQQFYRLTVP